jgi:hypothetical protein
MCWGTAKPDTGSFCDVSGPVPLTSRMASLGLLLVYLELACSFPNSGMKFYLGRELIK